jgi:hypothetical protein
MGCLCYCRLPVLLLFIRAEAVFVTKYLVLALGVFAPGAIVSVLHGCTPIRGQVRLSFHQACKYEYTHAHMKL